MFFLDPDMENDEDIKRLRESMQRVRGFNTLKNFSLYASLIEGRFRKPSEVITVDSARLMVELARRVVSFYESSQQVTRNKIEEGARDPKFLCLLERFLGSSH